MYKIIFLYLKVNWKYMFLYIFVAFTQNGILYFFLYFEPSLNLIKPYYNIESYLYQS